MQHGISRRALLLYSGLGALGFGLPVSISKRPNIILVMADDLGYGDLGCYGNPEAKTPYLDALARMGARFTDFHSNGAVCSPTRAALLTGRYQQRCGIEGVITAQYHRNVGMEEKEVTFADLLKKSGYRTALFGKWHLGYAPRFNPVDQGFDRFQGFLSGNVDYFSHIDQTGVKDWWRQRERVTEKGYATDLIKSHATRFIKENRDKPFCLFLAHGAPHYPYQGPNDKAFRKENSNHIYGDRPDKKAAYLEMIESLDNSLGTLFHTLKSLGLFENTFLFFCSDNGPSQVGCAGPLNGKKGDLLEGGHRVPGIACWPAVIPPGNVIRDTVLTMDLFPTLVSICSAKLPNGLHLDGKDLSPLFQGKSSLGERTLFWRFKRKKAVRQGPWKLLIDPKEHKQARLFNLDADLGEKEDLAEKHPDKVIELAALLKTWEGGLKKNHPPMKT